MSVKTFENTKPLPRILIYQSEDCSILVEYLTFRGFNVITSNEEDIIEKIRTEQYDLCILDHYKSTVIGNLSLLKILRKLNKDKPVIMVSDLAKYQFILEAYDEGTDAYVTRPYNFEVLIRQINVILTKRGGIHLKQIKDSYMIGEYKFDVFNNMLYIHNTEICINYKESQLLALLCAYKGELLPLDIIFERLFNIGHYNFEQKRALDILIYFLRSHLKKDKRIQIITQRKLGYSLVVHEE